MNLAMNDKVFNVSKSISFGLSLTMLPLELMVYLFLET